MKQYLKLAKLAPGRELEVRAILRCLIHDLLDRDLPWTPELAEEVVVKEEDRWLPVGVKLRMLERLAGDRGLPPSLSASVREYRKQFGSAKGATVETRRIIERLDALLGREAPLIQGDDPWTEVFRDALADEAESWRDLLEHCKSARASRPSKGWLSRVTKLLAPMGSSAFAERLGTSLASIGQVDKDSHRTSGHREGDATLLDDRDTDLLRGLIWCASLVPGEDLIAALGRAAEACFQKVPNHGPRNVKVGNACLESLSRQDDLSAVAYLHRLAHRARHPSTRSLVQKALTRAADRLGMSAEDLEEIATPTFGFDEIGRGRQKIGDMTAEIALGERGGVILRWLRPDGKVQKSVPKKIREEQPQELKALRARVREIRKTLTTLCARLEHLYLEPRDWDLETWQARYARHPVMGALTRRLIWRVSTAPAGDEDSPDERLVFWRDEAWADVEGRSVPLAEGDRIRLWHPLDSTPETVLAWRRRLEKLEVTQPFKQAHREIYLLTDAERQTETYSLRFAAHILKQHQLAALAKVRGWRYSLQGAFDSHNVPELHLPRHELTVEFWVEAGEDTTQEQPEAGIYPYVISDQVRFTSRDYRAMLLAEIPPLLFSEVLRDVDLFVGVASIGTDPEWRRPEHRTYWTNYAFGDLGTRAQGRKDVLERLIPRLAIADRCSIGGRFLTVRGKYRTYKIHLGSGNVLMSPNEQYLCIVPGSRRGRLGLPMLPFEGDATLSLILSKAFLLAEDHRIKDPVILQQIGKR